MRKRAINMIIVLFSFVIFFFYNEHNQEMCQCFVFFYTLRFSVTSICDGASIISCALLLLGCSPKVGGKKTKINTGLLYILQMYFYS